MDTLVLIVFGLVLAIGVGAYGADVWSSVKPSRRPKAASNNASRTHH
jgi:hypothetical protein